MAAQIDYSGPTGGGKLNVGNVSSGEYLVTSPTGPLRIATGTIALDGSNPTAVTTGLSQVVGAGGNLQGTAAPALSSIVVSANFATVGGTVNLYAWKVTSAIDATLVASTGTETVSWWAIGY